MKTFSQRVAYAAKVISKGMPTDRQFDDCFEMWDGSLVVTALVRKAMTDPELFQGIVKQWRGEFPKSWIETAGKYAHINKAGIAKEAQRIREFHD